MPIASLCGGGSRAFGRKYFPTSYAFAAFSSLLWVSNSGGQLVCLSGYRTDRLTVSASLPKARGRFKFQPVVVVVVVFVVIVVVVRCWH